MKPRPVSLTLPFAYLFASAALLAALFTAAAPLVASGQSISGLPALSIANARLDEGSGGSSVMRFAVTLSAASTQTVTVDFATSDRSAAAGADYTAASGTLVFAPGELSQTISVAILTDFVHESTELFAVTLSNPRNATIREAEAKGQILDDDTPGTVSIGDASVVEGSSGTTALAFPVVISKSVNRPVTVGFSTSDGTALAASDYVAAAGTVTIPAGSTSSSITVLVNGDRLHEPHETLTVTLSSPSSGSLGRAAATGTITNDDAAPTLAVALDDAQAALAGIKEGGPGAQTRVSFTATLSNPTQQTVTVTFNTVAGAANPSSVILPAGITFRSGETSVTFEATITGDEEDQPDQRIVRWTAAALIEDLERNTPGLSEHTFGFALLDDDYLLALLRAGSGGGRVVSDARLDCGALCSAVFQAGTIVTLRAEPDTTSSFAGWSGACTGTAPACTVLVDDVRTVTATFVELLPLTVATTGSGDGTVTSTPAGIDCGATCTATFAPGTLVTLTATPDTTSTFTGWSGACTGTGPCVVTMDASRSVAATFTLRSYVLTVVNPGGGTVTSSPAGISCGASCSAAFTAGTTVTLTATPDTTATFTGWSGACTGTASTCTVTLDADRSVAAGFAVPLTVTRAGSGGGTVTSSPVGIDCGGTCAASYAAGSVVTLSATPDTTSTFAGWTGACSGTGPCTISMTSAKSVAATFVTSSFPLTVARTGSGSGTVTSSPLGIACGATCSASFSGVVSLAATPDAGSLFAGWSGACSGTGSCLLTMDAAKSVTATFTAASLPSLSIANTLVTEGDTGTTNAVFTVTLSAPSTQVVTVNFATSDIGTPDPGSGAGFDYVPQSGTLTFSPGQTTRTITVLVNGDLLDEDTEFFRVNLSGAVNATIADPVGQATLGDNDPQPTITINDVLITEGNSGTTTVTLTPRLSHASGRQVTVNYTTRNGTATAGSDYVAKAGTVFIARGALSTTIQIQVNGDLLSEPNESFSVDITAANATVVDGSGEVKIQDDDPAPTPPSLPALSINSVSLPEGSLSQNVAFTVTLSAPSMLPVTVQWATTSDSTDGPSMATEGVDYVKIPLDTLTFDPGQTSRLVYVIVNGDTAPEPNERYYVKLANPTNATIAVGTGVGTILNDD